MTEKADEQIELEEQRKVNNNLCQTIEKEHILRGMLVSWFLSPIILTFLIFVPYVLLNTGVISIKGNPVQVDIATLQTVNSDIFTATITVIGIVLGIVPLLSFFYLGELKDLSQETRDNIQEDKVGKSDELKGLLDSEERLHRILYAKLRKTVKKYTEYAVVFSVISLLVILLTYFYLGFQNSTITTGTLNSSVANNLAFNVVFNITILFYVITEVFPLIGLALFDVGYKVVTLVNVSSGEECTAYIPE